jgi:thiol-disulfide isomerase/thioredoxin
VNVKPDHAQKRLWLSAGAAALLSGVAASLLSFRDAEPQDEAIATLFRQSFPRAAGPKGKHLPTSTLALSTLQGKTLVLNFWATWCPPCVEEMPDLSKLDENWRRDFGEKVVTLGIGIDSVSNIVKFYEKLPVGYELLGANTQGLELIRLLGNPSGGLPFSVIVSPKGKIIERILGRFDVKKLDLAVHNLAKGLTA